MSQTETDPTIEPSNSSPAPVSGDEILQQLRWRYATKAFDPERKISEDDWRTLEAALVLTPSSFGLQPWKFIVVKNPELRAKLVGVSWNQQQVADASHLVVFAVRRNLDLTDINRHIKRVAEVRGLEIDSLASYRDMMSGSLLAPGFDVNDWAGRQVYIALGNFMTCAAMMGIDTCPMEGIQPSQYDAILGINTKEYITRVVAAAGYRAGSDLYATQPKVRYADTDVIQTVE